MISITNHGAACCVIECNGVRILCDPWFTPGAYLGCWEREDFIRDPVKTIGPCDYIWISHLHEDHYDPVFLRTYLATYPKARLLIGYSDGYLHKVMQRDGFDPDVTCVLTGNAWGAVTFLNGGYENEIDNIDTALVVVDADSAVVNMNDNPYDQVQIDRINALTAGKHVTALLPYAGAGPWPQCFAMSSSSLFAAANDKRAKFLAQFERYRLALHADVAVPFSAGYRLRGPLAELNAYRGIPSPYEVPNATVLPVVGVSKTDGYVWEDMPMPTNDEIERLLQQAAERSPKVEGDPLTIDLDWCSSAAYVDATNAPAAKAHETITMDPRLLHGLLTRRYHWNVAEISSALKITRHADAYDARVFDYLYRFYA